MKTKHGPANHYSDRKTAVLNNKFKELFGDESEGEEEKEDLDVLQLTEESELCTSPNAKVIYTIPKAAIEVDDLDVLQITIENDIFKSPRATEPIDNTQQIPATIESVIELQTIEPLPITPGKYIVLPPTHQSPLTPKINTIRKELIWQRVISPLSKTPTNALEITAFAAFKQPAAIERQVIEPRQYELASVDVRANEQTSIHTHAQNSFSRSRTTNTKIKSIGLVTDSRTLAAKIVKPKNHQSQANASSGKCKETNALTASRTTALVKSVSSHTNAQSIVERHNFSHDIKITLKNNNKTPSTASSVERRVVDTLYATADRNKVTTLNNNNTPSIASNAKGQVVDTLNESADRTRIITLNNKYTPNDVYLAVAVKKDKFLSKNALKKITRNLASQM